MERAAAHAVDDRLHIAFLAANKGVECALVLFLVVIDQILSVLFAHLSDAFLLPQVQTYCISLHAGALLEVWGVKTSADRGP